MSRSVDLINDLRNAAVICRERGMAFVAGVIEDGANELAAHRAAAETPLLGPTRPDIIMTEGPERTAPPGPKAPLGRPDTSDHRTTTPHEFGNAFDLAWHVDVHPRRRWPSWMWRLVRVIATGMAIALTTDLSLGRLAIVSAFVAVALLAHDEVSA